MNTWNTRKTRAMTRRQRSHGAHGADRGDASAFTLIELLVVVAMIGIISLGIAKIFRSVGDTVRGGKRVSNLNTYSALIERQMRKDFESMTRSGFMVIRNRNVGGTGPNFADDTILLAPGDPNQRMRRGDEIVFFANGDFTSLRSPVHQDRVPRSTEAMVYYGFGLKWDKNLANYRDPVALDQDMTGAPGFGRLGLGGARGPDQYASDWILARRAFLMLPPNVMVQQPLPNTLNEPRLVWPGPPTLPYAGTYEDLDRNVQIGLQPAAISPFRIIARDPRFILPPNNQLVRDEAAPQQPILGCGAVDIIASSLEETRNIVIDCQPFTNPLLFLPFNLDKDIDEAVTGDRGVRGASFQTDLNPSGNTPLSVTKRMHQWMREALPANSDGGRRLRVEPTTPDWTGSIDSNNGAKFDRDYKRTDMEMLTSANFVPHCTEFIVEYSFGKVYPPNYPVVALRGQLIWHGQDRKVDLNGDGALATDGSETVALPYGDLAWPVDPSNPARRVDAYPYPYQKTDGTIGHRYVDRNVVSEFSGTVGPVPPRYAYFGFMDPTWHIPTQFTDMNNNGRFDAGEAFEDANGNNMRDANGTAPLWIPEPFLGNGDAWYNPQFPASNSTEKRLPGEPDTIPWPWPRLIRVTMSIVDPLEPLSEQTFQFTFEVPGTPEGAGY